MEADTHPQLQRCPEIDGAPDEHSSFGRLRGIELVQRAVVAPPTIIRRIMTEPRVAKLIPVQCPVNQESQGGLIGPLPARQFGSAVSWKEASRASMAAFTATAWWMIGTSPA